MRIIFFNILSFVFLASCSNISFLISAEKDSDLLKNKTSFYVDGWDKPILKDVLFIKLGEVTDRKFLLRAKVNEKQTKRSVSENQAAQKIDYKITINYSLSHSTSPCLNFENIQTSSFSHTPKSSGYNFASDVLLQSLYEESILINVNNFLSFANNKLQSDACLNEG